MSNKTMLVITNPTLDTLFNSIVALSEMGVSDAATSDAERRAIRKEQNRG